MNTGSKMVSFRADWHEFNWLRVFNNGHISGTIHVLLNVARFCLNQDDFQKWRWLCDDELRKKKLILVDKDAPVCNTESME